MTEPSTARDIAIADCITSTIIYQIKLLLMMPTMSEEEVQHILAQCLRMAQQEVDENEPAPDDTTPATPPT
jgi:hypothetical protein